MAVSPSVQKHVLQTYYGNEYDSQIDTWHELIQKEIAPKAKDIDLKSKFPRECIQKLSQSHLIAAPHPKELGGSETPFPVYIAGLELVSQACASTSVSIAITGTVIWGINQFGSDSQKQKFLPDLISANKLACFSLTEASAGSDAGSIQTKANLQAGNYILNGSKVYATNGSEADLYMLFAQTPEGPSCFLIDSKTKGISTGPNVDKLGVRGSDLCSITLKDVSVPKENLLGEAGKGLEYAKLMLNEGRITMAAFSVGVAQAAMEKSISYTKNRQQFGKILADFQVTQFKLANMDTEIEAARQLTCHAALLKEQKKPFFVEAARAKLFSSEMALRVCDEAIQLHGGMGYVNPDIHRHWRDAKACTTAEGTSEILRLLIAHQLLK